MFRYGIKYSPLTYAKKRGVATLIVHGNIGEVVPLAQSKELSEILADGGIPQLSCF
ncbi:hypothetical protein ACJVDH_02420 [Pedobacter sp. AW1-32]|uniref:hypothetical protein n=1 Tax=Pedobacter sp. AW1-32 TaxID=3383026 RepID=UPI003FF01320